MAQVITYVDPDAPGPTHDGTSWNDAYLSLSLWNTGEATNLVTDGDYHTCYCRSSSGTADTTYAPIGTGWTTGSANYIEIIGTDFPSDGIYDSTAYRIELTNAGNPCIYLAEDFLRISNLQFQHTTTGASIGYGIRVNLLNSPSDVRIDSCIVKGVCSGTGTALGMFIQDAQATVTISNTIVYGWISGADTTHVGIECNGTGTVNIYNCTIYNCYRGILRQTAGTVTVKNCAVGNCTDDFAGTVTVDYCCSDDGDGTNVQAPSGGAWTNEFTDPANGDFSLLVGGNCVDNGTDDPSSGIYSDDIIDTARVSPWDIGAFEYTAGGGGDDGAGAVLLGTVF